MAASESHTFRAPDLDAWHMRRALSLATRGLGAVEPNPLVGCVIARGAEIIGEGWHERFGGPHAEVVALRVAGRRAAGAVMYVTLEPCCHTGKTPPCTEAILAAGIRDVVTAQQDPFPAVSGGGIAALRAAGVRVVTGVLESEAQALNAPYHKLLATGRPWVIAKWAMTLDGRIATSSGASQWISGEASRRIVHQLRGRVDAILVGRRTVEVDNPLLTARPPGPRLATRVVLDTQASLDLNSQLARSAGHAPVLVAASRRAPAEHVARLRQAEIDVFQSAGESQAERLDDLLAELGRRRMTNVLVEGGGEVLGTFFDQGLVDEVHVFVAPKVFGGQGRSAVAGIGRADPAAAWSLENPQMQAIEQDVYVYGRVIRENSV